MRTFTCTCGATKTREEPKITAHEWDDGEFTIAATHTSFGEKTYSCPCGESYTERVDKTPDHKWDAGVVTTPATHTAFGVRSFTCICGATKTENEPKTTAHEWNAGVVTSSATHIADGVMTYTCACGETKTDAIAKTTEHEWDAGSVTTPPTTTTEGVKTFTCACGETKTESIPKLVANIENTDSSVTLEIPANSQATLPAGTVIDVVEKSNEEISQEVLDDIAESVKTTETDKPVVETLGVYDLNLVLDGANIQPNGAVVVTLPAPQATTTYDRIVVVYIAPNGSHEECKTTVNEDGTISFETNHFSKYAIIGINVEDASTGLGAGAIVAIVIGAVLVLGAGGFAIYWFAAKKKKTATEKQTPVATESADE